MERGGGSEDYNLRLSESPEALREKENLRAEATRYRAEKDSDTAPPIASCAQGKHL